MLYNTPFIPGALPASLELLYLCFNYNQPFAPGVLPSSLIDLEFSDIYSQPIDRDCLPSSLKHITLFNLDHIDAIPPSVTELSLHYNKPLSPGSLPLSITRLNLNRYNQVIEPDVLPHSLCGLKLDSAFKKRLPPLDQLGALCSLQVIVSEDNVDEASDNIYLGTPNNPRHVIYGESKKELTPNALPSMLPRLTLSYTYNRVIKSGSLPHSLTHLVVGNTFREKIKDLPKTLKYLTLGDGYNLTIKPGVLPEGLVFLKFGYKYDVAIRSGVLPQSLKELEFGKSFNQVIHVDSLPQGLKSLIFGADFNQEILASSLPSTLCKLTFVTSVTFIVNAQIKHTKQLIKNITNLIKSGIKVIVQPGYTTGDHKSIVLQRLGKSSVLCVERLNISIIPLAKLSLQWSLPSNQVSLSTKLPSKGANAYPDSVNNN
eukprot:gene14771-17453_t